MAIPTYDVAEVRRLQAKLDALKNALADPVFVHGNILRGNIALTKEQAIHIAGLPADIEAQLDAANRKLARLEAPIERAVVRSLMETDRQMYPTIIDTVNSIIAARVAAGREEGK